MVGRLRSALVLGLGALVSIGLATPALAESGPDALKEPTRDGCTRNPASLITEESPEWVYVHNTPANQPPPAPRWATGIVDAYNKRYQAAHTSGADLPFGHNAYDLNTEIRVLPQYAGLLGGDPQRKTGNYAGNGEETARLHTEWEDLTVPKFAWPEPGDRVTERGSWVWDCGHFGTPTNVFSPDYFLPHEGQPCPLVDADNPSESPVKVIDEDQCHPTGERTELHPYRAMWVQRRRASTSPSGERQADMFISTRKTFAGKVLDCAHKHPPPPVPPVSDTTQPVSYGVDFRACVEVTEPEWQDVSGDYSFLLRAPRRPDDTARLTFRAVDHGSSANAPVPQMRQVTDNTVLVSFEIHEGCCVPLKMAYTFYAGWDVVPANRLPTHLRVTFNRLTVHRMMDPGCTVGTVKFPGCQFESNRENQLSSAPGDWDLYLDASGVWRSWGGGVGEFLVRHDGQVFPGDGRSIDLYVPAGAGWRLFVHGRECDLNAVNPLRRMADCPSNLEIADNNDVPGGLIETYPSAAASLGTHTADAMTESDDPTSTCPDQKTFKTSNPNPHGCYSLDYTVTRVQDLDARALAYADLRTIRLRVRPQVVKAGRRTRFRFVAISVATGKRLRVRGAVIRFAGTRRRTNRHGRATIVKRFRHPGRRTAYVTAPHLHRGRVTIRVVR